MLLSRTAHADTFCRDHLPPPEQWPRFEFDDPALQYPERMNCATALLDDVVERLGGDRPCVITSTECWTYADVQHRANQIAAVLCDDFGLIPGQRVLLRGPNTPWLVACWFAVMKAGAVAVTTMTLLRSHELRKLIDLTRPSIVLCDHRFTEEMAAATPAGSALPLVCYGGSGADDLSTRAATKPGAFVNVDTACDDVALLAPTSGTTGTPKATMQFHRDVLAVADTFGKYVVDATPDDVFTGSPPLSFTYGLGGLLIFPMRVGAATVLLEKPTTDAIVSAVREHGATILFTAPTAYRALLREEKAPLLANLRRCMSAGEHLPRWVWQAFQEQTGLPIIDGIGATEMMHVFISSTVDAMRPGSTGRAVPGYRAAILDAEGNPVPDGTPGRLAVIGPTGCRYLADDRQRSYVQHGWNITGDVYIRDADGYFWYQARNDDMIVSSGYNIAGPEIEEALERHSDVLECAVVGKPDPERGAVVHATVVLRQGVAADADTVARLQSHVRNILAPYKYPRSIAFTDTLPRTTTGKVQRSKVRAAVTAHDAASPAGDDAVPGPKR
ncbi:AMP-binding protein [Mycolicibacterium sp. BiH015]|uniref:AMP-binding protein n=1 Tax=Mycolicibacterium sp. BiH015 TaxID=3018808 RepID=UPI0022E0980C|nr:AMP-binding protein [Mycolicibacterium sp. BiH015]MDA2893262.1 AMP-binding protein [Mycolicibacterium sp. BiH015]